VRTELEGRVDLILDGGACAVGLESTILSCLGTVEILRPGGLSREAIEAVLGRRVAARNGEGALVSPGMLASHYAPRAGVRLDAHAAGEGEAVLDFAGRLARWREVGPYLDLSARGDLTEAAANLFAYLRRLDQTGAASIAVAPVPGTGLGEAVNDRLRRAAAPRD
jgi:L-threonylcarbamoyladenylate synthase